MTGSSQPTMFAGAVALVFGGAKGIGRAVALEWAARGSRLAVADIDEGAAQETAAAIEAAGGTAIALHVDVLSEASIAGAIANAQARLGTLDILMNNVGAILNGHPEDIPVAEYQRIIDLNYFSMVRATQQVLPAMLERGAGHLVNTASFAGFYPYAASRIPYASAKAAVISYSQNLAIHAEPQGVRVSCLIPGPVMTGVMEAMTTWTPDCPMRGPGAETTLMLPADVARVLADGMEQGRVLIPSDPVAFDILRRWAADPDAFVREKIAAFATGDRGMPQVPEAIRAAARPTG